MNAITKPAGVQPVNGAFSVDVSRGERRGELSAQWFSRPSDQRFLSLDDLYESTARRRDTSFQEVVEAGALKFRGSEEEPRVLKCITPDGEEIFPTHHAFGQLCQLGRAGRAAEVFRGQPSWLAAVNLQYQLTANVREQPVKVYGGGDESLLRAATGPDYGRIFDADVTDMVRRVVGNGTGDSQWKVPGVMDWRTMKYNPYVDVSKETTTLFASDRDVFLFLCDDMHPIEIGTLANGDPDLVFRGFYVQNSEVGTRSLKIATFWLRAVCQNRSLWGVEDFESLSIVHSKFGAERFAREAQPALQRYAASEPTKLLAGINAAKAVTVAKDDDERKKFLTADSLGFSMSRAIQIIETHEREEGRKPETVWDMCNGVTALARTLPNQDNRLELEGTAAKLMNRAARQAHLT